MLFKTLVLVGVLGASADNLRGNDAAAPSGVEHLDLEVTLPSGERELFPLLPGTKCPPGHRCRSRAHPRAGENPMTNALRDNFKLSAKEALNWEDINSNLETVINSDSRCTRRNAMKRAAGLAAGVSLAAVSEPAYAAETKMVKMGTDSGLLAFEPKSTSICKGDSVKWVNNKGGPHNVVFDEEAIPSGVDAEKISCPDQMGEEEESCTQKFDTAGSYAYYCEPHRGAGMQGALTVA